MDERKESGWQKSRKEKRNKEGVKKDNDLFYYLFCFNSVSYRNTSITNSTRQTIGFEEGKSTCGRDARSTTEPGGAKNPWRDSL